MNTPKITVLMPAYNAEKYIAEAIRSVLDQTLPHFELLIINDGSTDGMTEAAMTFAQDRPGVTVIRRDRPRRRRRHRAVHRPAPAGCRQRPGGNRAR